MNIDGETNLKLRKIPANLDSIITGESPEEIQRQLNSTKIDIICEKPNAHIYKFEGRFYFLLIVMIIDFM